MSKPEYETIELEVTEAQKLVVEAIMNEGALRERERVLNIIETQQEKFVEQGQLNDYWLIKLIEEPEAQ